MLLYDGIPVTHIEAFGFVGFKNLIEITIPESIVYIGNNAFADCENVRVINYKAKNCISGEENIFYNTGFNGFTLNVGELVERIPDKLLMTYYYEVDSGYSYMASNVTEILFNGNKLKYIGSEAFAGAYGLTTLTIPKSVTYIGIDLFNLISDLNNCAQNDHFNHIDMIFENQSGWSVIDRVNSNYIPINEVLSNFFNGLIISNFMSVNSYYYVGDQETDEFRGYEFERTSDAITFELDLINENNTSEIDAIYLSRADKIWYSDIDLTSLITKLPLPVHYDESYTFVGYYYDGQKIVDWDGTILDVDMGELIHLDSYINVYRLYARWEAIVANLSADKTTVVYNSGEEITLTTQVRGNQNFEETYKDIEILYVWYRNGEVIEGATSSTYIHESTIVDVGEYAYVCEVYVCGKVISSNEVNITVNHFILEKPSLTPNKFDYDGMAHVPQINGFDTDKMAYVEGYELIEKTDVGTYVVKIMAKPNYAWGYDEENGYNIDDIQLIWSITGYKVTLLVDETYNNGTLSYSIGNLVYSSDDNNKFTIRSNVTTITATANDGYGFYYYTIEGATISTTVYNTIDSENIRNGSTNNAMFEAQFDLKDIKEDITITGYFVPVITLNIKVEKETELQGLISYSNLVSSTYNLVGEKQYKMIYSYTETTGDSIVATASVFAEKNMVYVFGGASDELSPIVQKSYDVISKLTLDGEDLLNGASMSINTTCAIESIIEKFYAGKNCELVYKIIEVVSLKNVENKNEISTITVTPSDSSEGVRIAGDIYVKPNANVGITVEHIAEGYTFVGFKAGSDLVYLYNDKNLGYQEVNGCYTYSFGVKSSMSALVFKNFTEANTINVSILNSAILNLTHNQTKLEYNLDSNGIKGENSSFINMMQGEYTISGLTSGTMTITLYYSTGEVISTKEISTNETYTFIINDTTTNVSIIVK